MACRRFGFVCVLLILFLLVLFVGVFESVWLWCVSARVARVEDAAVLDAAAVEFAVIGRTRAALFPGLLLVVSVLARRRLSLFCISN